MKYKKLIDGVISKINAQTIARNGTKIYWCKCGRNNQNFGDIITKYIYLKVSSRKLIWWNNKNSKDPVYFGSGSIMASCKGQNNIIWGSGILHSKDTFDKPAKILCVRGPLTRKRFLELGYECPEIYGDLGLLLPKFYNPGRDLKFKIGIIPHYTDFDFCKKLFTNYENILVIDVCNDVETVVDDICKCEMTMCSSLHGIIVSHAYNIKSCWVKFSDKILGDEVKYLDYYYSINLYNVKEPIIVDQEFISYHNNALALSEIIKNYPNPEFPINTEKLMKTCPF